MTNAEPHSESGHTVQFERLIYSDTGRNRVTRLVTFHDTRAAGLPARIFDEIMADFFGETEESDFSRGDEYLFVTSKSIGAAAGVSTQRQGTTLQVEISIKPAPPTGPAGRNYQGTVKTVDRTTRAAKPGIFRDQATFDLSVIDNGDARTILEHVKRTVAECAADLNGEDPDPVTLGRCSSDMQEVAALLARLNEHTGRACY